MFKSTQFDIDPKNPFENDKLDRTQVAKNLSTLVGTFRNPTVLSIDAPWGAGKTTFIKMWCADLRLQGCECVYLNAWENDFARDPLIPFVATFDQHFRQRYQDQKSNLGQALSNVKEQANRLVDAVVRLGVKGASADTVDISQTIVESTLAFHTAEIMGRSVMTEIEWYEDRVKARGEFHSALEMFVAKLPSSNDNVTRPVIFFIDELDRCRPTFAIELLETVKHLFNVPGLVFVLAMDTEQLAHSVKAVYGQDFGATGYLRRFIDLQFRLPEPNVDTYIQHLYNFYDIQAASEARNYGNDFLSIVKNIATPLALQFNLGLRDLERCFRDISLSLRVFDPWRFVSERRVCLAYDTYLIFLVMLRIRDSELYRSIADMTVDFPKIRALLHTRHDTLSLDSHQTNVLEAIIDHTTNTVDDFKEIARRDRELFEGGEKEDGGTTLSDDEKQRLHDRIHFFDYRSRMNPHRAIIGAVEFAGDFNAPSIDVQG